MNGISYDTNSKKGKFSHGIKERIYKINVPAVHVFMFSQNTFNLGSNIFQ